MEELAKTPDGQMRIAAATHRMDRHLAEVVERADRRDGADAPQEEERRVQRTVPHDERQVRFEDIEERPDVVAAPPDRADEQVVRGRAAEDVKEEAR